MPAGSALVGEDLAPSRFLAHDWSQGGALLLTKGSTSGHLAILARSKSVPMIVGLPFGLEAEEGDVLVDGIAGEVILSASTASIREFDLKRAGQVRRDLTALSVRDEPARTSDGAAIGIFVNISHLDELDTIKPSICDGIGLVRTEFLFQGERLPNEDRQYGAYRRLLEWAAGRPVTIRTLDAGADKPLPGLTTASESNPFLGMRGIRLSLAHPCIFRVQLRALLRAARHGTLKILLPMITVPGEMDATRTLVEEELAMLRSSGHRVDRPPIGMMVEVPAAAAAIDTFAADFYSIGSNDLTQYATAAGRDIPSVANLADPLHPGVLRLIETVTRYGLASAREVSLCGEIGSDERAVGALLRVGLRALSVTPAAVARLKLAISALSLREEE
jgi:phosphotransferase system enzyme I (PtsI)